jgi:phosphoribosyl-AMP cyclohydrolase/phosphoribosyl-ATP pyrophosphohydrolase
MSDAMSNPLPVTFGPDGLVPAVIREATTGEVLMFGFLNQEALAQTRSTGLVHYWSRSRKKLWRKGETSGHVQHVREIHVNCEHNSLLIDVEQTNAVCHDGYPTCFYRRLERDNSLTIVRDRWFDPDDVYAPEGGIAATTRIWWAAYETMRDHDFTRESGTSRMLRQAEDRVTERIIEELRELAGALDGTHRHSDQLADIRLEVGQVCYWIALRCVRDGLAWERVRPDRALDPPQPEDVPSPAVIAELLRYQAASWEARRDDDPALPAFESMRLAANCCVIAGVIPTNLIRADLNELRTRRYLELFFASLERADPGRADRIL